jgi:hypothetical protein
LADRKRFPLIIKYNYVSELVRCQLCATHTSIEVGPELFRENGGAVCHECGLLYAPELVEVLPHAQRLFVEACGQLWSHERQMD